MPAKFRAYFTSANSDANEKEFVENVKEHFKKIDISLCLFQPQNEGKIIEIRINKS